MCFANWRKQGNYSLWRPPKLIIQKIFNKQKWATVYRFMCYRICKSKCLVFQRHFDILFHNLSKINLDVFIRLFHLYWTFKCNWKSLNVDKKQIMTLWPRHNGLWSGRSKEVRPKGPADAPSNTRWLHGRASSVTQRADGLTPLEFWEGPGHPEHDGGCWVSNNMPRVPAVLIIKFTRADSSPPKSSNSQDAQDAHQRPQRKGNKEVLELVLGSRWYPQPLNAANERQSSGDETRKSWDELRRGHHNMIWERSQVFSARTKRWPERNN